MALEETVDSLDVVDDKYHDLYTETEDGKYTININGLKTALSKERSMRKSLEKRLNGKDEPKSSDDDLVKALEMANNTILTMKIEGSLKGSALMSGIDADYIDDVVKLTRDNFDIDENGNVVVLDKSGEITGKSVDDYFKIDFKKSKPRFYNNTGKTGGGSVGSIAVPDVAGNRLQRAKRTKNLTEIINLKQRGIK